MLLNAALLLGILASIASLSDLLLRESQRKAFQLWVDDLTLRLDYLRPLQWFNSIERPSILPGFVLSVAYLSVFTLLGPSRYRALNLLYFASIPGTIVFGSALPMSARATAVTRLLQGSESLSGLIVRAVAVAARSLGEGIVLGVPVGLLAIAVNSICLLPVIVLLVLFGADESPLVDLLAFPIGVASTVAVQAYFASRNADRFLLWRLGIPLVLSVVVVASLFGALEMALKVARAAMWRLAEFPKGPVAALTLLATASVAIARLVLQ
jgi:hypothetical protein